MLEIGLLEVGVVEPSLLEVGAPEVGLLEIDALEVGLLEVGAPEVGFLEAGAPKVGVTQNRPAGDGRISPALSHDPRCAGLGLRSLRDDAGGASGMSVGRVTRDRSLWASLRDAGWH